MALEPSLDADPASRVYSLYDELDGMNSDNGLTVNGAGATLEGVAPELVEQFSGQARATHGHQLCGHAPGPWAISMVPVSSLKSDLDKLAPPMGLNSADMPHGLGAIFMVPVSSLNTYLDKLVPRMGITYADMPQCLGAIFGC